MWRLLSEVAPSGGPSWTWLTQGGPVGILALVIVGFWRGWIVSGAQHDQLRVERDRALEQVYKQAEIAQRALEAAERKVVP